MTTLELVGAIGGGVVTLGVPAIALLRFFVDRLWKRVDKLETRLDECDERHDACADELAALKLVTLRGLGVGEDTGKLLIDDARASIQSQRPLPPPLPRKS
jgi:hypothetical protein